MPDILCSLLEVYAVYHQFSMLFLYTRPQAVYNMAMFLHRLSGIRNFYISTISSCVETLRNELGAGQ
jgi:hypothetical protein